MEPPWTFTEKIIGIAFCLIILTLVARSIVDKNKVKDEVDSEAESLYHDRDVVGQTRDWLAPNAPKEKTDLPLSNSNNLLLILIAIFMTWILLRMGSVL
ncbi:hypothetical protein [Halocola ammonii]